VEPDPASELSRGAARRLAVQREISRLLSPLTALAATALLRLWLRLSFEDLRATRREYRRLRGENDAPLLVCGNHLTMIDSALIAWALGSPWWYIGHFSALPWNMPDRQNFASTWWQRALAYVYKCVPVERGGSRQVVAGSLARFTHLLARGEVALVFPEGGRSRTARVDVENAAYGVGRIVRSVPDCRVLCVYLRGDRQRDYAALPARGDRLRTHLSLVEPKSDCGGLRGSRDVARQIVMRLAEMEEEHFHARQ
jgi:1-acyl-sn-glycerol-3-phosphate acyltransferase